MTVFTGIVLYMMIYWLVIFAVLPFGNKASESVDVGNVHSAPDNPRIRQKFIATAFIAALIWLVVFSLIKMDVFDFYDIAKQMSDEDLRQ